ncbi:MAG: hypothetical protein IH840_11135 [Candidatus Heimdallarchaeota archaeon]|nr:hypothetical protein [Candidatus Heimdallarchaeota archaeon]
MKDVFITILRDKKTSNKRFREIAHKISLMLASEVSETLATKNIKVETPFATTEGKALAGAITLIPILRAGIAMLDPFLQIFESASVGFVGLKRDEKTAVADLYYSNIPELK